MAKITHYCSCGAVLTIEGNVKGTENIANIWEAAHLRLGHQSCLAAEADPRDSSLVCPKCGSRLVTMYCIACGWSLHGG